MPEGAAPLWDAPWVPPWCTPHFLHRTSAGSAVAALPARALSHEHSSVLLPRLAGLRSWALRRPCSTVCCLWQSVVARSACEGLRASPCACLGQGPGSASSLLSVLGLFCRALVQLPRE